MDPIQDLLFPAAAQLLRPAPLSAEKVACAWQLAVGAGLARVSSVRLSDRGVLDVEIDDARWRREIDRSRTLILGRLHAMLGPEAVSGLAVRTPRAPASPTRPHGPRAGTPKRQTD